jgi:hypothetical protein
VLVVDKDACKLYETWDSHPQPDGSWHAGSGAVFDMRSNALRPAGWTSADAAGLPIRRVSAGSADDDQPSRTVPVTRTLSSSRRSWVTRTSVPS